MASGRTESAHIESERRESERRESENPARRLGTVEAIFSLVIPVYKNRQSLPELLEVFSTLSVQFNRQLEVVFVVDGSPDESWTFLDQSLPAASFPTQLLLHSRNFGSFAAIRAGLKVAKGQYFAVMAADLQEPPELAREIFQSLSSEPIDIVLAKRESRDDPFVSRILSGMYWRAYRKFVQPDMPEGGVDMFGCNRSFLDRLLDLGESNSSLVGLVLWLGFRRKTVGYHRQARRHGKSAWSLRRKLTYLLDSVFAFSDLPLRLLMGLGAMAMIVALVIGLLAFVGRLSGYVQVPGYTMIILAICFFGASNVFALGLVGSYIWRAFENTKGRPLSVVRDHQIFIANPSHD